MDATLCFVCDDNEIESAALSAVDEKQLIASGKKKISMTELQPNKKAKKESTQGTTYVLVLKSLLKFIP